MNKRMLLPLTGLLIASVAGATTYTVKPGDTLSRIARQQGVRLEDLMAFNRLTPQKAALIFPGQTLRLKPSVWTRRDGAGQLEQLTVLTPAVSEVAVAVDVVQTVHYVPLLRRIDPQAELQKWRQKLGDKAPREFNLYDYALRQGLNPAQFLNWNGVYSVYLKQPTQLQVGYVHTPAAQVTRRVTQAPVIEVKTLSPSTPAPVSPQVVSPQSKSGSALPRIDITWDDVEIRPGDTLSQLAETHGTTVAAIRRHNRLDSDTIIAGKTIQLPE